MARLDIAGRETAGLGDDLGRHRLAERERLRRREARPGDRAAVANHLDRHEARELLEHHRVRADGPAVAGAFPRQHKGGADIGVAGERHLRPRREDAHLRGVRRVFRRQHEGCLGEIELAGDRLHLSRCQPAPVEHHGERIAAERPVGEHVDGDKSQSHGGTRKELPSPHPSSSSTKAFATSSREWEPSRVAALPPASVAGLHRHVGPPVAGTRRRLIGEPDPAARHASQQQLHGRVGLSLGEAQAASRLGFARNDIEHHNSPSVVRRVLT
jgi:hypothetical protein